MYNIQPICDKVKIRCNVTYNRNLQIEVNCKMVFREERDEERFQWGEMKREKERVGEMKRDLSGMR